MIRRGFRTAKDAPGSAGTSGMPSGPIQAPRTQPTPNGSRRTSILLALDPGLATGYAIFEGRSLLEAGTWKADHEANLMETIRNLALDAGSYNAVRVVIEEPSSYGWHGKSHPAAQAKLQQRIGLYVGLIRGLGARVQTIPVSTWKSSKSKDTTQHDMTLVYGPILGYLAMYLDQNAWDAIGLGHWAVSRSFPTSRTSKRLCHVVEA